MAEPQLFLASLVCMYLVLRVQGFFIRPSSPPSFPTTIFSRSFSRNLSLYANSEKINGEDPKSRGDCKKKTSKEPKTGWTHSTPDPTSDFWEPGPERPKPNEEPKKLRTGWLHNAESKEKKSLSVTDASGLPNSGKTGGFSEAQRRLQLAMRQQERNHRIIAPPTLHACGTDFPIVITEHKISLPLSRVEPSSRLDVYFTIVEKVRSEKDRKWFAGLASRSPQQRAGDYVAFANMETATDMILYLQGGPGFGAPVPVASLGLEKDSSWAAKALEMYTRVVLMDQRGTGQSTPITKQTLEIKFPNLFLLDSKETVNLTLNELEGEDAALVKQAVLEATSYLSHFRADNIVQDAEEIRDALLTPIETDNTARPWGCSLGQSFGGFCLMTYLSQVAHPPQLCLFTGGIAPILTQTYDVYASLWERAKERSLLYYDMYPSDIVQVKKIVSRLLVEPVSLPSGGKLTARRFLQLGLALGGSPTSFARLHALINSAFVEGTDESALKFRRTFLKEIDSEQNFDDAPIYFWLHESIYANGKNNSPTHWTAHRAYEDKVKSQPDFDFVQTSTILSTDQPTLFFSEMVFPWMAEDYAELKGVGLNAMANDLAAKEDWGKLVDEDQMREVLSDGRSTAAAAVYYDDLYVDFDSCMKVTAHGGPLEACKVWITNDYQHSGLRDDGALIFAKLHGMANGCIRTPS
jgi:pimeloyl-ACP methyl ester carboxylesterase